MNRNIVPGMLFCRSGDEKDWFVRHERDIPSPVV